MWRCLQVLSYCNLKLRILYTIVKQTAMYTTNARYFKLIQNYKYSFNFKMFVLIRNKTADS